MDKMNGTRVAGSVRLRGVHANPTTSFSDDTF